MRLDEGGAGISAFSPRILIRIDELIRCRRFRGGFAIVRSAAVKLPSCLAKELDWHVEEGVVDGSRQGTTGYGAALRRVLRRQMRTPWHELVLRSFQGWG